MADLSSIAALSREIFDKIDKSPAILRTGDLDASEIQDKLKDILMASGALSACAYNLIGRRG